MASTSRILVVQIALGAAFGTALAWKTARVRRAGPVPRAHAGDLAGASPAPYGSGATRPNDGQGTPAATSRIARSFKRLPEPAAMLIVIAVAALVPVIIGVSYGLTRSDGTQAPAVHAAPSAAPVATSPALAMRTPTLADELLDARRELDLGSVLTAANAYASLFGAYPSTDGQLTTLCLHPTDAGCEIAKYSTDLSVSDGQFSYWYASDGRSLTLLARVQTAPAQDDCPADLPDALAGSAVACLRGTIGTQ